MNDDEFRKKRWNVVDQVRFEPDPVSESLLMAYYVGILLQLQL